MKITTQIGLVALMLAIGLEVLLFEAEGLGINLFLSEALFLAVTYGLAHRSAHVLPKRAHITAAFATLYAATFAIWTSDFGFGVAMIGFLAANFLFVAFVLGHSGAFRNPWEIFYGSVVVPFLELLGRLDIFAHMQPSGFSQRQRAIVIGAAVAVPVLLVFLSVLAGADPIFGQYMDDAFAALGRVVSLEDLPRRVIAIVFFFGLFSLVFAGSFWKRISFPEVRAAHSGNFVVESQVIIGVLAALFLVFLGVQASALFGNADTLARIGITYAEYARTGFSQLIWCSVLVATVILVLRAVHGPAAPKGLRVLYAIFLGETFILLISAFQRLSLYCQAYGFTPTRLFAYWMIALVAVLLALLKHSVWTSGAEHLLMRRALLVMGVAGLLFVASAPDALSVRLNIVRAERQHQPVADVVLFSRSSPEAFPQIRAAYASPLGVEVNAGGEQSLLTTFSIFCDDRGLIYHLDRPLDPIAWQSWNLSRARARTICEGEVKDLEAYCNSFGEMCSQESQDENQCELCGVTKASSYASCHSKEFCNNTPME